jgi:hypothetical protein
VPPVILRAETMGFLGECVDVLHAKKAIAYDLDIKHAKV